MTKPARTIADLRADLDQLFMDLKSGAVKPAEAIEMNNAAGKIIATVKMELNGYVASKMKPNIPYLALTEKK